MLVDGLDDEIAALNAFLAVAPWLQAGAAHSALALLSRRTGDLARRVAAQAALLSRLPVAEREPQIEALWSACFRGWTKDHRHARRSLLEHLAPQLWPEARLRRLCENPEVLDNSEACGLLARGLLVRGEGARLMAWIDASFHSDSPSEAPSLISAAAAVAGPADLAELRRRVDRVADARQREIALANPLGRQASLGEAAQAWQQVELLQDGYARKSAVNQVAGRLRGAELEPALRLLGRIGDEGQRAEWSVATRAAFHGTPQALVPALNNGALRPAHWGAQLAGRLGPHGDSVGDLKEALRGVHDTFVFARLLLELDRVQRGWTTRRSAKRCFRSGLPSISAE